MRRHGQLGLGLVGGGLALGVVYAVVIWYAVFMEDTADSVCGAGVAEEDNVFPPYTACASTPAFRVTSAFTEYAGATLFVLAAAMQICGAAVMIAERYRRRRDTPEVRQPRRERPQSLLI